MTGQVQAARSPLLDKGAVALISQEHVFSDPHGNIDIVKTVAIDVRYGKALLLVGGDRSKIRMGGRLHALAVKFHGRFVMPGAPGLREVLRGAQGAVERLAKQP